MKVKKNYILPLGITLFLLIIVTVILLLKPVEYLSEKIKNNILRTGGDVVPDNFVPEKYYSFEQDLIDVTHYQLEIELFPFDKKIRGNVKISGRILDNDLKNIVLNFYDNFSINKLQVNGVSCDYDLEGTRLNIERMSTKMKDFVIEINYEGTPMDLYFGSFNFTDYFDEPYVYTINEPVFASTWFPCNDLPDDKAVFDISIGNDSSMVSISNGKLLDVKTKGDRKVYHWQTKYPTSTYLVAVYSGKYTVINDSYVYKEKSLPLVYYAIPDNANSALVDFDDHPKYIRFFSETFGEYPFIDEKYGVAEILWMRGAIENQTITGVGTNFINGFKEHENLLVHELAHHWWGNAVGPATWKDVWLNEGFATYSTGLYLEYDKGPATLNKYMREKIDFYDESKLYNPGFDLFSQLVYDKGAWVLHMLRNEIGEKKFFAGLRNYYNHFKYKSASTNDFKQIMEVESGKDLSQFFDQWVYTGKGIIEVEYEFLVTSGGVKLHLTQLQTGYDVYHFPLELDLAINGKTKHSSLYVFSADTTVDLNLKEIPEKVNFDPGMKLLAKYYEKDSAQNK